MSPGKAPSRPRIRSDLEINRQTYQGQTYYVLKDPVTLRYFRFQKEEYAIIRALDGSRDLRQVHEVVAKEFRGLETGPQEVGRFVNQLAMANLLVLDHPGRAERLFEQRGQKREAFIKGTLSNILFVKIPVFDPDELFTRLYRALRLFWTRSFLVVLCWMVAAAIYLIISRWGEVAERVERVEFFTLHNLPFLWFAIVIVKALHEFGHGLTCKHFGGEVHELGWLFLVFTPCFYCNVSDAWMIPHKRGKLLVTAAGVLTEIFFAAIAVFLWWWTPPGVVHSLTFNIAVVCSVSAILFNANPLLRYDGYYFLMDALEIPNLRAKSSAYLKHLWHKYILGIRTAAQSTPPRYPRFFVLYAVAAYCYRWMILIGIVYFVTTFLDKYGLGVISRLLGGVVIVTMFVRPIWMGLKRTIQYRKELHVRPARIGLVFGGLAAILVVIGLIPISTKVRGSAVIEARGTEFVWVRTPGIVREIRVREGDWVDADQVLARLEDERLDTLIHQMALTADQFRAEAMVCDAQGDLAGQKRCTVLADGADARRAQWRDRAEDLVIRAPIAGRVIARDLDLLVGRHLPAGALLCRIGDTRTLEARVLIQGDEYGNLFDSGRNVGQETRLTFFGQPGRVFHGTVRSASVGDVPVIRYPQLAAPFGGEVVARIRRSGAMVPVKTQYEAVVTLDGVTEDDLLFGMTGRATVLCKRTRLYRFLYNSLADAVAPRIPR